MTPATSPARTVSEERYRAFRTGFSDGAFGAMDKGCVAALQPDYDRGYTTGRRARIEALSAYAAEVGIDVVAEILRKGGAQ